MHNTVTQIEGFNLVINYRFTAPARRTARQIRFAVIVGIKQFRQFRVFQLIDMGNVVFFSRFLINQITLRRTFHISPFAIKFAVTASGLVHIVMQRLPVYRRKGGITGCDRGVTHVVIHFAGGFHGIAQFFQRPADQQCLEGFFCDGTLYRFYRNAGSRQIGCGNLNGSQ